MKLTNLILGFLLLAACTAEKDYNVDAKFSSKVKDSITVDIEQYISERPYGVLWETRFDPANRPLYIDILPFFTLKKYYVAEDSTHYYLIWKKAPSISGKQRIAIGGSYKVDAQKRKYNFIESFVTPKMDPEPLEENGSLLFEEMVVKKGDLSKYIGDKKLIDFPDQYVTYNKEKNTWDVKPH